ncbi:MAG: DoxX family protein [candidate division Zixibacteria bacterium HGW-Zixibacteria-1]|nr:MAG: DoxX family protein [candidate division Zixibacteria bacterium HGW-Zixibacteria-1]
MPFLLYFEQTKETFLNSWGLLILRVGVGSMMLLSHGWGKLMNFSEIAPKFADPLGFGTTASLGLVVFAEVFASLALIFGFMTRLATFPLIITMLVAVFLIHAGDPFGRKELPLMFLISYVTILISGPGKFSLDRLMFKKQMDF